MKKILLLGYGKEGSALENYFKTHPLDPGDDSTPEIEIWQDFTPAELQQRNYSSYDIIFRSPSVPPYHPAASSVTKYFFDHCPAEIIGVTATKGKGTTCSFIKALLDAHGEDAYLVGNIGEPAINALDQLTENSVVVYEMSSFQLWDLEKSPHISVIGTIEPDHLNVHKDYDEYKSAKANICRYQTAEDYCIYYQDNPESVGIANQGKKATKIPYPFAIPDSIRSAIKLPGEHNVRNAIAAIAAMACYYNISPDEYIKRYENVIIKGLSSFKGLPHRLEFVRELGGIKFYDDNFSTNPSSTRVAIEAFKGQNVIPIIGGLDKTNYEDLPEIYEILASADGATASSADSDSSTDSTDSATLPAIVLMGESGHEFAKKYQDSPLSSKFKVVKSLEEAVTTAYEEAKKCTPAVVLMSPTAASFDMFKNVYDRGDQYQNLVKSL